MIVSVIVLVLRVIVMRGCVIVLVLVPSRVMFFVLSSCYCYCGWFGRLALVLGIMGAVMVLVLRVLGIVLSVCALVRGFCVVLCPYSACPYYYSHHGPCPSPYSSCLIVRIVIVIVIIRRLCVLVLVIVRIRIVLAIVIVLVRMVLL